MTQTERNMPLPVCRLQASALARAEIIFPIFSPRIHAQALNLTFLEPNAATEKCKDMMYTHDHSNEKEVLPGPLHCVASALLPLEGEFDSLCLLFIFAYR